MGMFDDNKYVKHDRAQIAEEHEEPAAPLAKSSAQLKRDGSGLISSAELSSASRSSCSKSSRPHGARRRSKTAGNKAFASAARTVSGPRARIMNADGNRFGGDRRAISNPSWQDDNGLRTQRQQRHALSQRQAGEGQKPNARGEAMIGGVLCTKSRRGPRKAATVARAFPSRRRRPAESARTTSPRAAACNERDDRGLPAAHRATSTTRFLSEFHHRRPRRL